MKQNLHMQLTAKAHVALKENSYPQVKESLQEHFKPSVKTDITEPEEVSWGDYADELCVD